MAMLNNQMVRVQFVIRSQIVRQTITVFLSLRYALWY